VDLEDGIELGQLEEFANLRARVQEFQNLAVEERVRQLEERLSALETRQTD
jgi:hypothetical protein